MKEKKYDIIIPYTNCDSYYRERNLKFALFYYKQLLDDANIIVVEQDTETDLSEFDYITHYKIKIGTDFNKSKCLNYAVKHSKSKYIFLLDNDIVITEDVLKNLNNYFNKKCLVYLYNMPLCDYNSVESTMFINARYISEGKYRKNLVLGGAAMLISRKSYYLVGGFDETFVGWGGEDTAFHYKCEKLLCIKRIDNTLYHLYHESAKRHRNTYKKELDRIKNMTKEDLIKYSGKNREYFLK